MLNLANPNSGVIEQMRQARIAQFVANADAVLNGNSAVAPPSASALDPRLEHLRNDRRFASLLRLDDPTERDAALEAIQILIDRCGYHWRSALSRRAMKDRRAVRQRKATQYPERRRGRPLGAHNFAARQFGLGLAMIWWEHTGRPPSRHEARPDSARGSYLEFVELVTAAVPPVRRKSSSAAVPESEYLARISIQDFRAAQNAPEEYRRRGLIDERLWLSRPLPD